MVDFAKLNSARKHRQEQGEVSDEWAATFASEPYQNTGGSYFRNEENNLKAPKPTNTQTPKRDDSQRLQFFSVEKLAGIEQVITIKSLEFVQSNYGDVTFTLEMNGREYLWDRKLNSNAYAVILGAFGEETDDWIGKSLTARPWFNPKFKQTEAQLIAPTKRTRRA